MPRGRPPGSRNKPKRSYAEVLMAPPTLIRGRGRPAIAGPKLPRGGFRELLKRARARGSVVGGYERRVRKSRVVNGVPVISKAELAKMARAELSAANAAAGGAPLKRGRRPIYGPKLPKGGYRKVVSMLKKAGSPIVPGPRLFGDNYNGLQMVPYRQMLTGRRTTVPRVMSGNYNASIVGRPLSSYRGPISIPANQLQVVPYQPPLRAVPLPTDSLRNLLRTMRLW